MTPSRRILSVWLPNWPITRLTRRLEQAGGDTPADAPLITAETVRGRRQVASAGPDAAARGLRVGQTLADARALCPGLVAEEADPQADGAALMALAAWCERYTPMAAPDPPDGLWLDVTGVDHLFGGEAALVEDVFARLTRAAIPCRIALAGTPGAAWALARSLMGHDRSVIASGMERAALARLPVAALRLDARAVAGLRRLGLRTVVELARMPRPDITARFGSGPVLRLDQAFGVVSEAIDWPRAPTDWSERLALVEPIATPEDLRRTLDLLAGRLCVRLEAAGAGAHRVAARFFRVDQSVAVIGVATALPVRDPAYLARLLAEKLDTVDPGFGIETVVLDAEETAPLRLTTAGLINGDIREDRLSVVVDMLSNRLGNARVWRAVPHPSHVPERAVRRAPVLPRPRVGDEWPADPASPRPIRLLRRPEPIEATAPVPDDPPVLFRWRGVLHRVRAAAGPERIAAEWWRASPPPAQPDVVDESEDAAPISEADRVRDYYQVEDQDGARFWIFRRGLSGRADWFLHGLFA